VRLGDVARILEAEVLIGEDKLDLQVEAGCGCDLISDLLAFTKERMLVLTGLVSPQIIRAAEVVGLGAFVFVRGERPTPDIIDMSRELGLPIMCTHYPLYESAGLLFAAGLPGWRDWPQAVGGAQDAP